MSTDSTPPINMLIEEAYVRISVLELTALHMYALVLSMVIFLLLVTVFGFLHEGYVNCSERCKPKSVEYGETARLVVGVEKC